MNTRDEIYQALSDMRDGRLGESANFNDQPAP
jgi:hypothetical protein